MEGRDSGDPSAHLLLDLGGWTCWGVARGGQGAGRARRGQGTHRWIRPGLSPVSSEGAHRAPRRGNEGSTQNLPKPPPALQHGTSAFLCRFLCRGALALQLPTRLPCSPLGEPGTAPGLSPRARGTVDAAGPGSGSIAPSSLREDLAGGCFVPVAQLEVRQELQGSKSQTEMNQGNRGTPEPGEPNARAGLRPGGSCWALPGRSWPRTGRDRAARPLMLWERPCLHNTAQPGRASQQLPLPHCRRRKRECGVGVALQGAALSPLTSPTALQQHPPAPGEHRLLRPQSPTPGGTATPVESFPTPNPLHPLRGALKPQPLQCRL